MKEDPFKAERVVSKQQAKIQYLEERIYEPKMRARKLDGTKQILKKSHKPFGYTGEVYR